MYREQAKECRKKGIKVYLYTTICWDIRVAAEHPEWVAIDDYARISRRETGNIFEDPGFHVDLCINSPYREFCKEQIADALENCPGRWSPGCGILCCRVLLPQMQKEHA